jgi:CRP-like cAMP-binding protein
MADKTHLSTVEKVLFLKSIDIFEHATIEELGRIAALTQEVWFEAGETIQREGDPKSAIYIIMEGRALVQSSGKVVREVAEKHAVGVLGALGLNSASRTVIVSERVHALKLNVQDFEDILAADFDLVKTVLRAVADHIRQGL